MQPTLGQSPLARLGLGHPVLEPVHHGAGLASHEGVGRGNDRQPHAVYARPLPLGDGRSHQIRHCGVHHDDGLLRADQVGRRRRAVEH